MQDNTVKKLYRTNSHSGLPKGSYLVPNPLHFHIVQKKQISMLRKPRLTTVTPFNCSSGYLFNHNRLRTNSEPVVIVDFGNSHTVSLKIPIQIIKGFILPFANALNITSVPTLNTKSSQTTYMNNFQRVGPNLSELENNYTPLLIEDPKPQKSTVDITTSFEAQILQKMHDRIMDISIDSNTTAKNSSDSSGSSQNMNFYDGNIEDNSNESLADMSLILQDLNSTQIIEKQKNARESSETKTSYESDEISHNYGVNAVNELAVCNVVPNGVQEKEISYSK
ncbi:hypothetical protein HHI36_012762 [Cryptolaemus montrouzieri]|uniref:Uncharacterized protein n=1 Tax=Cryptolaemus montrouzieri TaxID=559131 RepID=A0ABD2NG20_9CUCU